MSNLIFTTAKGRIVTLGGLPAANDGLVWVALSAVPADAATKAAATLADLVTAGATEHPDMDRQPATGVTVILDGSASTATIDADDVVWEAVPAGTNLVALVLAYDPDTAAGDDSTVIPIAKFDTAATPAGTNITITVPAGGAVRAS